MLLWTAQYAAKYVAREVWVEIFRGSKVLEFKSGEFQPIQHGTGTVPYGTVWYRTGTVRYDAGTVRCCKVTVRYTHYLII